MACRTEQEKWMRAALRLARKGAGKVSPNPMVGALLVKKGIVVGKGYHRAFGGPHAEVHVLAQAGIAARGAELYVTLEPCSHHGKTPPCAEAVIRAGVTRVYVGMVDPNPLVGGQGIALLRQAGITVEVGICEDACRRLNEAFITYVGTGKPFVVLKAAMTLDGKIATYTGNSRWITCEQSRRMVHRLRAELDAVMVGSGTVLSDDPQLTVRLRSAAARNPVRVIVDSALRTPLTSRLVSDGAARTLIFTAPEKSDGAKARRIREAGAEVVAVPLKRGRVDLGNVLRCLGKQQIASVLLEGGATLNAAALEAGLVDKAMLFYAPKIVGGAKAPGMVGGSGRAKMDDCIVLRDMAVKKSGTDILVEGYVRPPGNKAVRRN
ncbi:MAG: bifunctional diaminohydroxyphosphoribosylaminopyrimidine deaminase/5-amino-6-(5-phosphoribosylamino)uracil reductase RibD [Deltaproteobacteria bacterium]|nr:bifunctional diaminohydroxyphosphoribosylaminopyrimidine deaminase/5-amino-6-(5-phosphoribosylamino)uracil reductase RibD [Deltaproteobacteria bacterium]